MSKFILGYFLGGVLCSYVLLGIINKGSVINV